MGLIKNLKHFFSSDIAPNKSDLVGLVSPYPLKYGKIKINSKLKVPENYSFVIGYNGKVLDSFKQGEYELSLAMMPKCCKKLKIHLNDKKNNAKKSFKANAYFVNMNSYFLNFKTLEKAELGRRATGFFKVGMSAKIKIKISDEIKFMEMLLSEYSYVKQFEAEKILNLYISDFLVSLLFKYNFALSEFLNFNPIILDNLMRELSHKLLKIGLIIEDMCDVNFVLPKKYQKEYEKNKLDKTDDTLKNKSVALNEINTIQKTKYVPFGNIVIEESNINLNNEETISHCEQNEKIENTHGDSQFVDLNLDNLYKDDKEYKVCKVCGYKNKNNAENCEVCENKLNENGGIQWIK